MATGALCKNTNTTHTTIFQNKEVCCCKNSACDGVAIGNLNTLCKEEYEKIKAEEDGTEAGSTNATLASTPIPISTTKISCEKSGGKISEIDEGTESASDTVLCITCPSDRKYVASSDGAGSCECKTGDADEGGCLVNNQGTMGIELNSKCLTSGSCSLNVYELLGIRKSDQNPDPNLFVQDIVLGATSFIGIVVTVSLVVAGAKYIFSAAPGNVASSETAKNGIFYAFLGLLLVSLSYAIIRIIQYIAAG